MPLIAAAILMAGGTICISIPGSNGLGSAIGYGLLMSGSAIFTIEYIAHLAGKGSNRKD